MLALADPALAARIAAQQHALREQALADDRQVQSD
jgi:hypothetical protein